MRIVALALSTLASLAGHCNHDPWQVQPVSAARVQSVYFDSGAVVRMALGDGSIITGALLASVTPGGEEFVIDVDKTGPRRVRLTEIQRLTIPWPGTSIWAANGYGLGGLAALAHDKDDDKLFVAGMLGGAIVGGAIGSRVTRWLTVARRSEFGNLTWMPLGPEVIPATYDPFAIGCARGASTGEVLVAVVDYPNAGPFHAAVHRAWAVDTIAHHMVRVETAQIRCRNENWETRLPQASAEEEAVALKFTPAPGKALIYVHQHPAWGRHDPEFEIVLDGRRVGRTSPGTYRVYEVEPGAHRVAAADHDDRALLIEAAADSVYFVRFRDKRGLRGWRFGGVEQIADRARGEKLIAASQLLRP